jgi:hypothetical protein
MRNLPLLVCASLFTLLNLNSSKADAAAVSNNKASSLDDFLPLGLVMKSSPLPTRDANGRIKAPNDYDFHITLHDHQTAIIWTAKDSPAKGDYLCGAICPLGQDCSPYYDETELQAIVNSDYKMITKWIAGDADILSPAIHNDTDWQAISTVGNDGKWIIAGVHKKNGVPIKYYIKNKNRSAWVSREEALDLSLDGRLEIIIP